MASLIDKMRARMDRTALIQRQSHIADEQPSKTRHLVQTNRWDDRTWDVARRQKAISGMVEDLVLGDAHKGGERNGFEPAPELTEGLFQSFYRADPTLIRPRHLEQEVFPAHKILKEVQQHPQFEELREQTASDPWMSAIAVEAMQEAVTTMVYRVSQAPPPPPPPMPPGPQDPNAPKQPGGGGQPGQPAPGEGQPGDQPAPGGQGGQPNPNPTPGEGEGGPEHAPDGGASGDETLDERDLSGDAGEDLTDNESTDESEQDGEGDEFNPEADYDEWEEGVDDMSDAIHDAIQDAANEVEELDQGIKGIGLDAGQWRSLSDPERKKIIQALRSPEMKMLADMIGRMKRFALGARAQRLTNVPHEAYDVEQGSDLRRVLRSEMALLGHPTAKYEFFRRYSSHELLQFKMRGTEDAGKGPMIVCIDKSGSMSGQPMRWAVGAAEALRRFAADDGRDFLALFFGSNHDRVRFVFPKGVGPIDQVLKFIGTVADGGTQFDGVLTEALEKASGDLERADIVFITDGASHLTDEWIADYNTRRKAANVRLFSVYIGGAYDTRHSPVNLLEKFSDGVVAINELTPQAMSRVFQSV